MHRAENLSESFSPVDTGSKLNVHKTFRRRPGRLLNVLCTFNLRLVSTGSGHAHVFTFITRSLNLLFGIPQSFFGSNWISLWNS